MKVGMVWTWLLVFPLLSSLLSSHFPFLFSSFSPLPFTAGVNADHSMGAFIIQDPFNTIAEYGLVQNGSIELTMYLMPDSAALHLFVCTEDEQNKLLTTPVQTMCANGNRSPCTSERTRTVQRFLNYRFNVSQYGRYYVNLVACGQSQPYTVVNWTSTFTNPAPFRLYQASSSSYLQYSHLDNQMLPVVATEQVAGLVWACAALAYLVTLRQHWRRARLLQKIIAIYPIAKIIFAYYAGDFYSHYSEYGYFTAGQWAGYWTFAILLKAALAVLLMTVTVFSTSLGSRIRSSDVVSIVAILIGIVIVSALECSVELSQLSSLILWMTELVLYVVMLAFLLSGVTSGLSKTGTILKSVIRRNTLATSQRVASNRNLREARLNSPANNNSESAPTNADNQAQHEHDHANESPTPLNQSRAQDAEFLPVDLSRERDSHNGPQVSDEANLNSDANVIPDVNADTNAADINATLSNGSLESLSPAQLTNLNNSIAYLLPYIWFTRFNLFVSFKFVLIFWVFLQIVVFFINLVAGTSSLNWVSLMTAEILDFIIFAGVIYTFLMSSRYPFSDSMTLRQSSRSRSRHDPQVYLPLLGSDHDLEVDQNEATIELELEDQHSTDREPRESASQSSGLPSAGPGFGISEEEEEEEEEVLVSRSSLANK